MLTTDVPVRHRTVRDLRTGWRRTLAALLPLPALALAVEVLMLPYAAADDPVEQVRAGLAATGRLDLALWLGLLGGLVLLPAVLAAGWAVRRHAPRLALAGTVLSVLGVTLSWGMPHPGLVVRAAAGTGLDPVVVGAAMSEVAGRPASMVALVGFLTGMVAGSVLLGVALWRTPTAPRWAALALAVSGPAHVVTAGSGVLSAGAWLLAAAGFAGASLVLLRTRDGDFDLPPADRALAALGDGGVPGDVAGAGSDVRRGWQWLLGATASVTAAWIAVGRYLLPYNTLDDPRTIFDKLVGAPGFMSFGEWAGLLTLPFILSGVIAVVWVSRRRAPVLTTVGAVLAVLGYAALSAGGSPSNALVSSAASGALDREVAFVLGSGAESLPQGMALGLTFVAGHLLGTVLLGLALWRGRSLPAWAGVLLALSQPVHLYAAMTGNHLVDLFAWGTTALCFGAAGVVVLRLAPDEFDLPRAR